MKWAVSISSDNALALTCILPSRGFKADAGSQGEIWLLGSPDPEHGNT